MLRQSFLALLLLALSTASLNAFEVTIDSFAIGPKNTTVFTKTIGGDAYTISRSITTSNLTGFEDAGGGNWQMTYADGTGKPSQGSITYNVLKNGGVTSWGELFKAKYLDLTGFVSQDPDWLFLDLIQVQQFGGTNGVTLEVSAGGNTLFDNSSSPWDLRSPSDPFYIAGAPFSTASDMTFDFNIAAGQGAFTVLTVGSNLVMTPEPASLALFGSLLGAVTIRRRRR